MHPAPNRLPRSHARPVLDPRATTPREAYDGFRAAIEDEDLAAFEAVVAEDFWTDLATERPNRELYLDDLVWLTAHSYLALDAATPLSECMAEDEPSGSREAIDVVLAAVDGHWVVSGME